MWSDKQEGVSKELLHYTACSLLLLHIKAAVWTGTRGRNVRNQWQMLAKLSSGNVLPDNSSKWGAKKHNAEHGERQAVQPSCSTAFIVPIQDPLASVDGLPLTWPGLELGPLGTKTKDLASDFN